MRARNASTVRRAVQPGGSRSTTKRQGCVFLELPAIRPAWSPQRGGGPRAHTRGGRPLWRSGSRGAHPASGSGSWGRQTSPAAVRTSGPAGRPRSAPLWATGPRRTRSPWSQSPGAAAEAWRPRRRHTSSVPSPPPTALLRSASARHSLSRAARAAGCLVASSRFEPARRPPCRRTQAESLRGSSLPEDDTKASELHG